MTSNLSRSLLLSSAAGFGLSLLSALPASAHGGADAGLIGGALHPLLGIDHLLLLVGVGLTAAQFGPLLLGFAIGGAALGSTNAKASWLLWRLPCWVVLWPWPRSNGSGCNTRIERSG